MASRKRNKDDNRWSEGIYDEILELIINKLKFVDRLRFKAVCKPWNRVMREKRHLSPPPELPWLMFSGGQSSESMKLLNFQGENRVYEVKVGDACSGWCCGSSEGWLVMADKRRGNFLLNPFSGDQIPLPHQSTIPHSPTFREDVLNPQFIRKAILSCTPTSETSCIVVAIDGFGDLYFCRPGDKSWTILERGLRQSVYDDIIFYKGQLHAITYEEELKVFSSVGPDYEILLREKLLHVGNNIGDVSMSRRSSRTIYLIESDHKLLVVFQFAETDCNDHSKTTYQFKVNEVDDGGKHLFPVESLGDRVLFLGKNCSKSFKVSSDYYWGAGGNRIYFTDCQFYGVYQLEGSKCNFPRHNHSPGSQSVWIIPDPSSTA